MDRRGSGRHFNGVTGVVSGKKSALEKLLFNLQYISSVTVIAYTPKEPGLGMVTLQMRAMARPKINSMVFDLGLELT